MTSEQLKNSMRLYQLADEARQERSMWRSQTVRGELAMIANQLEEAARKSLSADEDYGDAWAEAGTMHIRRYTSIRKFGENTYRIHQEGEH